MAVLSIFPLLFIGIAALVILCFSFVLLFGAPFLPTLNPQIVTALDLLDVKPGQTMLELGCGDGRVLVAAAQRGAMVIGYELNPILVYIARMRTRRFHGNVKVICANFWHVNWPPADTIFTFLLTKYMSKLDKKIIQYKHKPVRLASFAFSIPKREPSREKNGIFLYEYR